MKKKLLPYILFVSLLTFGFIKSEAQDIHYTLYNQVPMLFNPAHTGAFNGTYRISGIYRDQYRLVENSAAFKTPGLTIDSPISKGFRDDDWVGVGASLYIDRSGSLGQQWTGFKLSGAYHFVFGRKKNTVFTVAYQTGSVAKSFASIDALKLADIGEQEFIMNQMSGNNSNGKLGPRANFTDHVGGLRFVTKYNKTDEFSAGLALSRFGQPDFASLEAAPPVPPDTIGSQPSPYRLDAKGVINAGVSFLVNEKLRISPSAQMQFILDVPEYEFQFQTEGELLLNEIKKTSLIAGVGLRYGGPVDALSFLAGLRKDNIKAVLAYDANISALSGATGGLGGLELSVVYIGKVYKRPNPDPVIFCPRF